MPSTRRSNANLNRVKGSFYFFPNISLSNTQFVVAFCFQLNNVLHNAGSFVLPLPFLLPSVGSRMTFPVLRQGAQFNPVTSVLNCKITTTHTPSLSAVDATRGNART